MGLASMHCQHQGACLSTCSLSTGHALAKALSVSEAGSSHQSGRSGAKLPTDQVTLTTGKPQFVISKGACTELSLACLLNMSPAA